MAAAVGSREVVSGDGSGREVELFSAKNSQVFQREIELLNVEKKHSSRKSSICLIAGIVSYAALSAIALIASSIVAPWLFPVIFTAGVIILLTMGRQALKHQNEENRAAKKIEEMEMCLQEAHTPVFKKYISENQFDKNYTMDHLIEIHKGFKTAMEYETQRNRMSKLLNQ